MPFLRISLHHSIHSITLKEHISFPEMVSRIPEKILCSRGWPSADSPLSPMKGVQEQLSEIGKHRIQSMDDAGIALQVLSVSGPGADLLDATEGPAFAKMYNNLVAEKIKVFPGRFAAFAHLPTTNPTAAADELERTVTEHHFVGALINGLTNDLFLDHPQFEPLLARSEKLGVPISLHPGLPPEAVRKTYYEGLPPAAGTQLGLGGFGWHSETAIHILRFILSGTLERYPDLKWIIGHMGEMLPVMMARCDNVLNPKLTGLPRTISQTLQQQVYITTSGIFTQPPLQAAIVTFGIDRILYSVDYPFSKNEQGKKFLNGIALPLTDINKIAYGNAKRLLKLG